MLPAAIIVAALALASTRLAGIAAQQVTQCDLATLFAHLSDIQGMCCIDGNECSSGYPGADDECSTECGEMFEPFWDSCGSMLTAMGVGGTEGMSSFYDSCLRTLYPPGSCADECTPNMMHCRVMEVQAACCGDPRNCPAGDPVPHSCPVGCALVFPFFLESCHDALEAQGSDISLYERFSQACTRQDTTALVEYAIDLVEQGCTVDLEGRRRLTEPEDLEEHVAQSLVANNNRRLQSVGTGVCAGFIDDPSGDLAAHGVSCEQALTLGCNADLSNVQPTMAHGSLVKFSCPVSCGECHRKGMAQWIETPNGCPWDEIDDRLNVVNEACCSADGVDPDVTCPRGGPPRACSALCAVTYHSLVMDCGEKLLSLVGETHVDRYTAFDELCTSERSVDTSVFLTAIASATCCITSCRHQLESAPESTSGVYTMCGHDGVEDYNVYCDMETDGGGWTMVCMAQQSLQSCTAFDDCWWNEAEAECWDTVSTVIVDENDARQWHASEPRAEGQTSLAECSGSWPKYLSEADDISHGVHADYTVQSYLRYRHPEWTVATWLPGTSVGSKPRDALFFLECGVCTGCSSGCDVVRCEESVSSDQRITGYSDVRVRWQH